MNYLKKILFFLFTFNFLFISGETRNLEFSSLTTRNGLSNNGVNCIIQDDKGFIWIGSSDGLNRYNGYKCDVFRYEKENSNSIPNNYISCLEKDRSGNLWVGTNQSGLARYNFTEEKFYRYFTSQKDEKSIPGYVIRHILNDLHNQIWVATDFGLVKYDSVNNNFHRVYLSKKENERLTDVRKIINHSKDEIIVQCKLGLYKVNVLTYEVSKLLVFKNMELESRDKDASLMFDKSNCIWVGQKNGIYKLNLSTQEYKKYEHQTGNSNSLSSNNISVIFQDSRGLIWIGTQDNGLNLYNPETDDFSIFKYSNSKPNSISNNIITNIFEDQNGNLWIATQEGGVNFLKFNHNLFEHFSNNPFDKNSLGNNKASSFFEDKNGVIWIGTGDSYINKMLENNDFVRYPVFTDKEGQSILAMASNGKNSIYIAGWGIGLFEFNLTDNKMTNLFSNAKKHNLNPSVNIKGMGIDSKGNVWLATHHDKGILVYNPTTKEIFNPDFPGTFNKDLLKAPYAVSMIEDSKKRIWIASYTGIYMFDSIYHAFRSAPEKPKSISSNYVYTIFEDNYHQIWIGNSNGLDKLIEDNGTLSFERISYKHPIPNNIKGILQDKNGNLWLSSNMELTEYNPKTNKVRHYRINRELPSQEFFERSCMLSSKGEMYFGGTSGFFRFIPDSITKSIAHPKVYITDFQLFNKSQVPNAPKSPLQKSILETREIELNYNQNVINFEYAAINFDHYKFFEYAYKLEGFDNDWYLVGDKHSVSYTNLSPGEYMFKVSTVDGNEISYNNITELKIIVHPPIWKTIWAYIFYFFILIYLLFLFRKSILYREQLKNELKLEKIKIKNVGENNLMKLRFFTNISHEFRTPLTLIKAPLEKLLKSDDSLNKEERKYYLELIHNNSERLLKMVNQLMDYRKLEAGSLVLEPSTGDIIDFCKNIWSNFTELAKEKQIEYIFKTSTPSLTMSFDADKMDKIINNLLSNAFKFTPQHGQIIMEISLPENKEIQKNAIEISVKDNGIGINEDQISHIFERFYSVSKSGTGKIEGTGIGLTLAKELVELHKGSINVVSKEGEGSIFKVILPAIINFENETGQEESKSLDNESKTSIDALIESKIEGKNIRKDKILIVEDDNQLREFIQKELQQDYDLVIAKDGEEGLRKAFFESPDLILSDVVMPNLSGFDLCKTIKSDERTSHLPVILLSAKHSQEKQLEGFDVGADEYIFKPFSVEILKIRVHNLLKQRRDIIDRFKENSSLFFDDERVENKERELIQSVINVILENISNENINADFIAQKLHISRSLIYIKIESIAGQTVNEFIRNIRLKKAVRLLLQNNLTITEIAYEVGFSSQSYFTRSFTKYFGMSPKEYLLQYKRKQ